MTKQSVTRNILPIAKRAAIIRSLAEGNSIRATARLCATSKATVLKLLGEFCSIYLDHAHQNLSTKRVEADELSAFVGAKAKNAMKDGQDDIWTYTALDSDSKPMISWLVGARNSENTKAFVRDGRRTHGQSHPAHGRSELVSPRC